MKAIKTVCRECRTCFASPDITFHLPARMGHHNAGKNGPSKYMWPDPKSVLQSTRQMVCMGHTDWFGGRSRLTLLENHQERRPGPILLMLGPILLLVTLIGSGPTYAQSPASHPGLDLCHQGRTTDAILPLENAVKDKIYANNAEIWTCLASGYIERKDYKKARKDAEKAVELAPGNTVYLMNLAYVYLLQRQTPKARSAAKKAIELDPKNAQAFFLRGMANYWEYKFEDTLRDADAAIAANPVYPEAYVLRSRALVGQLSEKVAKGSTGKEQISYLKLANETLLDGRAKCKGRPGQEELESEYEAVSVFYDYFSKKDSPATFSLTEPDPGIEPLKILRKVPPHYTDSARQGGVQGTIQLAVLFGANGKIGHVLLLKRLGSGLDEEAITAASKIVFQPAKKDGKPISVVKLVEYTFSIH